MTKRNHTRRSASQWQVLITQQAESGLSIVQYCKQNQLTPSNFYYWRAKLRESAAPTLPQEKPSDDTWIALPTTLPEPSPSTQAMTLRLSLPGGMVLTLSPS